MGEHEHKCPRCGDTHKCADGINCLYPDKKTLYCCPWCSVDYDEMVEWHERFG